MEDGDLSPPRKGRKFASDDLSPPRKERGLSPSRKKGKKEEAPKEVRKAGLMTAEEVKEDIRKIKEDEKLK
jgi:pre-mRNA-splicing factor CWC26